MAILYHQRFPTILPPLMYTILLVDKNRLIAIKCVEMIIEDVNRCSLWIAVRGLCFARRLLPLSQTACYNSGIRSFR